MMYVVEKMMIFQFAIVNNFFEHPPFGTMVFCGEIPQSIGTMQGVLSMNGGWANICSNRVASIIRWDRSEHLLVGFPMELHYQLSLVGLMCKPVKLFLLLA